MSQAHLNQEVVSRICIVPEDGSINNFSLFISVAAKKKKKMAMLIN